MRCWSREKLRRVPLKTTSSPSTTDPAGRTVLAAVVISGKRLVRSVPCRVHSLDPAVVVTMTRRNPSHLSS